MEVTIMTEEAPYNNRQIERMFDEQDRRFDKRLDEQSRDIKEHMDGGLEPILTQTTKTNGRMTKAEGDINELGRGQASMSGALKLLSWVGGPIIGLLIAVLGYLFLQEQSIDGRIQAAIDSRLQNIGQVTE